MVAGALEREVKLGAPGDFVFPDLAGLPGVVAVDEATVELDARYVDTPELDLVRRGASLRRRAEPDGVRWTLKLPKRALVDGADERLVLTPSTDLPTTELPTSEHDSAGGPDASSDGPTSLVLDRRELELDDPADDVPPALAGVVSPWVRDLPLVPVARLQTRRHRVRLRGADGVVLVELADDLVTVSAVQQPDVEETCFREIEAEARTSDDDLLRAVVARLEGAGAVAGEPMPKVERALGPAASEPPALPGPMPSADAGIDEVVAAALRARVSALLDAEVEARAALVLAGPGSDDRLGPALGAVLRAERALRATLRGARAVLDEGAAHEARTTLRRLAAPLLRAHDAVRVATIADRGARLLAAEDRSAIGPVLHDIELDAEAARHLLVARLGASPHLGHLQDLAELAERPPLGPTALGGPPPDAGHLAGDAWSRLAVALVEHDPGAPGGVVDPAAFAGLRPKLRRAWAMATLAAPTEATWAGRAVAVAPVLQRADDVRDLLASESALRGLANGAPRHEVLGLGALVGLARREAVAAAATGVTHLAALRAMLVR